jgi:acyl-coenzyme A synthetase/AMP-(fatty) acid ligase
MIFEFIHKNRDKEIISLDAAFDVSPQWIQLDTSSKRNFITSFIPAFRDKQKIVLLDKNHKQLQTFYENNDINKLTNIDKLLQLLFFTSGSSGFPVGAFKTQENLLSEVMVLKKLITQMQDIKRVVVSVPFVHIYGILAGLLLPLYLDDVTLVVKDDFLPYELLEEASKEDTLVVTTPVFIKALARLQMQVDLSKTLFISSTAPLSFEDVESLQQNYQTNIIQLFGSTETGGIAYKHNLDTEWSPLERVKISTENDKLSVSSPFVSPFLLQNTLKKLQLPFTTEDIVKIKNEKFTLLGRSNKIIKIAGKRISSTLLEATLETLESVEIAVIELVYKKELLRSEQVLITLQAKEVIRKQAIKDKISECYGVLTIPFKVVYVKKINRSAMGKKILF